MLEVGRSKETSQTSLIREAIPSGTCGIKICDHATKAAAFAKYMLEKEKNLSSLVSLRNPWKWSINQRSDNFV